MRFISVQFVILNQVGLVQPDLESVLNWQEESGFRFLRILCKSILIGCDWFPVLSGQGSTHHTESMSSPSIFIWESFLWEVYQWNGGKKKKTTRFKVCRKIPHNPSTDLVLSQNKEDNIISHPDHCRRFVLLVWTRKYCTQNFDLNWRRQKTRSTL